MRPSSAVSFLLLSFLLLHHVKGIRFKNGHLQVENQSIHNEDDKSSITKTSNGEFGEVISCKQGHCRGTVKNARSVSQKSPSHHKLPSIHEDYYGPRRYKPKHH